MAIITVGPVITGIRGSVGAVTFSRAHSGPYVARRKKPVFPRTNLQGARQAALAVVAKFWRDQLLPAERIVWGNLAANTDFVNSLGETYQVQPNAFFIRANSALATAGQTFAPTAPTVGKEDAPDLTIDSTTPNTITVITWPAWVVNPVGFLLIYLSRPVPLSQTHTPTHFNFQSAMTTALFATPTTNLVLPDGVSTGEHRFLRFVVIRTGVFPAAPPNNAKGVLSLELFADVVVA